MPRSKGKRETKTGRKTKREVVFSAAVVDREERRRSTGISHGALIKRTSLIRIVRLKRNHEQGDPFAEGFGGLDGREGRRGEARRGEARREADTSARDTSFCRLFFSSSFFQLRRSFRLLFRPPPLNLPLIS